MLRQSAGILLHRMTCGVAEVFLVHPGGPFYARRDAGVWQIPKGEFEPGETPFAAALREFAEETGFPLAPAPGEAVALDPVRQGGGKIVHAWALRGDVDAGAIVSNRFSMEWPPRSGEQRDFPEVDRAAWFTLAEARQRLLPSQRPILEQFAALLAASKEN